MVKTTLSRNGYKIKKSELSVKDLKEIKNDLTVNPFVVGDFGNGGEKRFSLFMESPNSLYIPRFYAQEKFGSPDILKMDEGSPINLKFNGSLRKEQEPIIKLYKEACSEKGGGLISLKCGGGKTVLALYLISILRKKTIVIVHKDFLMTQWRDRIQQFLPDARIGKIQQNTIDIEDKDIVLAMVQSLSQKEYDSDVFSSFGLAIFDECHHLGAEVFSKSMSKVASKYMLGLSATPDRKDGLRKVFEWYIGPMVYSSKKDINKDYIETRIYEYYDDDPQYSKIDKIYTKNGPKPCMPRMINNISYHAPRNLFINNIIKQEYEIGRKILILGDRREYLNVTEKWIKENINPDIVGQYVGGMKPSELRDSQEKDIILGTFSMASEGMDIPKLNTIILASPKSDVVQSVGRILREKAEVREHHPLVIDFRDTHPNLNMFNRQCDKRIIYYKKSNHEIHVYGQDGSKEKIEKRQKKKKELHEINICLIDDGDD
jgi:superfamily II DNA or RNA helicase